MPDDGFVTIIQDPGRLFSPDSADFDLGPSGDAEIIVLLAADDWTPPTQQYLIDKANAYRLSAITIGGNPHFRWRWFEGAIGSFENFGPTGGVDASHLWVRLVEDVSASVDLFVSTDPISTAAASVTWGDAVASHAQSVTIDNSTDEIRVGGGLELLGRFYYLEVLNAPTAGTRQWHLDFRTKDQANWDDLVTGVADGDGNTWTCNGIKGTDWDYTPETPGGAAGDFAWGLPRG